MREYFKEAPSQINMYPCPACHETISADATACRFCHLPIEANTAQQLLAESRQVTTAIAHANTFGISGRAAVLLTAGAVFNLYVNQDLSGAFVAAPVIALGYGAQWLYFNRSLVTHDVDYPAAITKVKWTMIVWLAAMLVQLGAYFLLKG